jgi:hypothetical protein
VHKLFVAFARCMIGVDGVWRLEALRLNTAVFLKKEGSFKELFMGRPTEETAEWFRRLKKGDDVDSSGLPKALDRSLWTLHTRTGYLSKDKRSLTVVYKGFQMDSRTDDWTDMQASAAIKYRQALPHSRGCWRAVSKPRMALKAGREGPQPQQQQQQQQQQPPQQQHRRQVPRAAHQAR